MTAPTAPPSPTPRWVSWALLALLLVSGALRAWDGSHGLDFGRSFDERFTLKNVTGLLRHGELRPVHAFYLGLSYYPQTAVLAASQGLHRLTGWRPLAVYGPQAGPDAYTPTAFLLCRLVNAAFGVASLYVVFLIGRRIHSPALGLLAAAVLAAFQRHLISSAQFKPDILVVLLTALTLLASIAAAQAPSARRFLLVGCGVGLAVGTKYTGIAAALPIAAAVPLFGRRDRRQWLWLLGAGVASLATFVAVNPYLGVVFRFIPKLVNGYAAHGARDRSDHWVVLRRELEFLAEQHGPAVAVFLAVGVGWLLLRLLAPHRAGAEVIERNERIGWSLVLALLLGHTVLHAAGMTLFRGQNYMPVAPASSLVAAWAAIELWRAATRRLPWLAGRPVAIAVWSVVGLLLLAEQTATVYARVVPTNWEVANRRLLAGLPSPGLRHVACERDLGPFSTFGDPRRPIVTRAGSLATLGDRVLDRTDVEAFAESRLGGPTADFYRTRMARLPPDRVEIVGPRLLRSRGERVVVLRHPWRAAGEPEPLALTAGAGGTLAARLPALAADETVSLLLWVPKSAVKRRALTTRFAAGGEALTLLDTGRRRERYFRLSPRFARGGDATSLTIAAGLAGEAPDLAGWGLELHRWRATAAPATGLAP